MIAYFQRILIYIFSFVAIAFSLDAAADYKGPVRCELIAQGYNIVVNMGDQPSDLAGGCAEKAFLLPNPFYRIP